MFKVPNGSPSRSPAIQVLCNELCPSLPSPDPSHSARSSPTTPEVARLCRSTGAVLRESQRHAGKKVWPRFPLSLLSLSLFILSFSSSYRGSQALKFFNSHQIKVCTAPPYIFPEFFLTVPVKMVKITACVEHTVCIHKCKNASKNAVSKENKKLF